MKQSRTRPLIMLLMTLALLLGVMPLRAQPVSIHLAAGNPSDAQSDLNLPDNYLLIRDQYALSYDRDRGTPNWVSWRLTTADLDRNDPPLPRCDASGQNPPLPGFQPDRTLPEGWYRVRSADYTNSGFDRGHMVPSEDRKATQEDNCATFFMTNIVPQAPTNNRGVWAQLEAYGRTLTADGSTLYIVAGGEGTRFTIADGNVAVPGYMWKAILVLPPGVSDPAQATAATAIAVSIPNLNSVGSGWARYQVSVTCIESLTGLSLFSALPAGVAETVKSSGPGCVRVYLPLQQARAAEPDPLPTPDPVPTPLPTPTPDPTPAAVQIAFIEYDPPGDAVAGEYLLLRNPGGSATELTGWTLNDATNTTYTFPVFTLAAGAEVRLWVRVGVDDAENLYWGRAQAVWNNTGDTATLRDASGALVDLYTYP